MARSAETHPAGMPSTTALGPSAESGCPQQNTRARTTPASGIMVTANATLPDMCMLPEYASHPAGAHRPP
jgi:hypothetical protein